MLKAQHSIGRKCIQKALRLGDSKSCNVLPCEAGWLALSRCGLAHALFGIRSLAGWV